MLYMYVCTAGTKEKVTFYDPLPELVRSKLKGAQDIKEATIDNEEEIQNRPPRVATRFKTENKTQFMFKRLTVHLHIPLHGLFMQPLNV